MHRVPACSRSPPPSLSGIGLNRIWRLTFGLVDRSCDARCTQYNAIIQAAIQVWKQMTLGLAIECQEFNVSQRIGESCSIHLAIPVDTLVLHLNALQPNSW